jgi:hypothetical protein
MPSDDGRPVETGPMIQWRGGSVWVGTQLRPADWREHAPAPPEKPEPKPKGKLIPVVMVPMVAPRTVTPTKAENLEAAKKKHAAWLIAYTRMSDLRIAQQSGLTEDQVRAMRAGEGAAR